ncbi:MAG TPA: hypothetical protein PKN56_20300, partial [Leptospiraceae bacterium]|nr:hypothetical protein [Leptospiraceae bacterium]
LQKVSPLAREARNPAGQFSARCKLCRKLPVQKKLSLSRPIIIINPAMIFFRLKYSLILSN